ncbi:glycerate kinase isoform X2 [Cloeon dipterum]
MAAAAAPLLDSHLQGGILSVPVGSDSNLIRQLKKANLEVLEGAKNNLPDNDALLAAKKIKDLAVSLHPEDILIILISGGGSALLPLPKEGLTLEDKLDAIKKLTRAGATINELNHVRIALSDLKGGQLATLSGTKQVVTLILSDIIGDPVHLIASGPTVQPLPVNTCDIIEKYDLTDKLSTKILQYLMDNIKCQSLDTSHVQNLVIGNNTKALEAAAEKAKELGYFPCILSNSVSGEVVDVSNFYGTLARVWRKKDQLNELISQSKFPITKPPAAVCDMQSIIFICGGEPTVALKGQGQGGRNQELALRVAKTLPEGCTFLSAGTDGIDGPTPAAGAVCDRSNLRSDLDKFLANNDSYSYLRESDGDLIQTGHTGTNVMDIHLLHVCKLGK